MPNGMPFYSGIRCALASVQTALLSTMLVVLAACGGGSSGGSGAPSAPATLVSMTMTPANPTQQLGTSLQLSVRGNYSDGSTQDLTGSASWNSSMAIVANVAPGGAVNALTTGSATITATSGTVSASTTVTVVAGQVTVTYLHTFQGNSPTDAGQPNGPLLQASDGNFYGTSRAGGPNVCRRPDNVPCGAIFRVTPAGVETVLYAFGASATDAYSPGAALIQGRDGALYGTTSSGGNFGAGTIFRITMDGIYTILHSFGGSPSSGIVPVAALMQASDGNFYGTTASGGANHCNNIPQSGGNCGTVFRMTPAGVVTTLHSFGASATDGVEPLGSLVEGPDGNFYGTTIDGGANNCASGTNNCGTVYRITPAGTVTVMHSFGSSSEDGIAPQGALILGTDGAFYGTTPSGGNGRCGFQYGCGTVFRMTTSGATTTLHRFASANSLDGSGPSPFLTQGRDGNFYGTTRSGGANGGSNVGTAFRLTPAGIATVLHSFGPSNVNPSDPGAGMIQGRDGAFYGVTFYPGSGNGSGTVFKLVVG